MDCGQEECQEHDRSPQCCLQDEDGSGYITVDELRKGLSRCSVDLRATDVQVRHFRV